MRNIYLVQVQVMGPRDAEGHDNPLSQEAVRSYHVSIASSSFASSPAAAASPDCPSASPP